MCARMRAHVCVRVRALVWMHGCMCLSVCVCVCVESDTAKNECLILGIWYLVHIKAIVRLSNTAI